MRSLALALLLAVPAVALAQDASAPPVQDWSKDGEVVIVTAERPGPALWHIARNGSDVWILGVVTPVPRGLKWNSTEIESIILGAKRVYLPPELTAGVIETSWFLLTGLHKLKLQEGQTLQTALPADLRARYAAWLVKLGKDADTDADYLPAIAALDLENMFRKSAGLEENPDKRIRKLAEKDGVPAAPVSVYQAMPIVNEVQTMSPANENACMKNALDDIDTEAVHAEAAARAWAVGDVAGIKANYSEAKLYDCFSQTRTFAADREHLTDDALNAVRDSLATPGKSLIVMNIGPLLRQGGLIDRLKQQNITVEGPPG
ncbi:MAG TPA: TraB/GumN family protein [Rhizomicrobium sp.]|nr:TraB/GumN family protein [Rhizomicrobium sp.]